MNIEECQLTDPEILTVLLDDGADGEVDNTDRRIANSATEKALRVMLLWLRSFEDTRTEMDNFIAVARGHGKLSYWLEMAATELEAMLLAAGGLWRGNCDIELPPRKKEGE